MLIFVTGEALLLRYVAGHQVDWHDIIFNLNSGHMMLWLFRGLEIVCYAGVINNFSLNLFAGIADVWVWIFSFVAWDFGFYWLHRLHHMTALLWAVHVVHHQGKHYNLSLGVRNSWYSSLTSIPFFVVLAWLGVPLSIFLSISILHYSLQFFNHLAAKPQLGFLEKIFVTPTHHRVHHINNRYYAESNFGGSFIIWDKLFGTFKTEPQELYYYGVKGNQPTNNPFIESNRPFFRYLNKYWGMNTLNDGCCASSLMIFSGTILVFVLVVYYIQLYGYGYENISIHQTVMFILLALGPIAMGGISQGQRWGVLSWFFLTWMQLLWFVANTGWTQYFWIVTMATLALHSLCVLLGWGRGKMINA